MRVPEEAAWRFVTLYLKLLYYAGKKRKVIPRTLAEDAFLNTPMATKIDCRKTIYEPAPLIDDFLADRQDELSAEEQEIVRAWNRHIWGRFTVLKHLKKHTIFLGSGETPAAYAVLGLTNDLEDFLPSWRLPMFVETALLPYEGVVVCDGLVSTFNIMIGPTMRRNLNAEYQEIRRAGGLITTL